MYRTFGTYWSVCVGYEKELERAWCAWTRARGVGAARERRDERCDDDDEGGRDEDDDEVDVDVDGWMDSCSFVRGR